MPLAWCSVIQDEIPWHFILSIYASYKERVFIPDKKSREKYKRYVEEGLDAKEHQSLINLLKKHQPAFCDIVSKVSILIRSAHMLKYC